MFYHEKRFYVSQNETKLQLKITEYENRKKITFTRLP